MNDTGSSAAWKFVFNRHSNCSDHGKVTRFLLQLILVPLIAFATNVSDLRAQENNQSDEPLAAMVGKVPIRQQAVTNELARILGNRVISDAQRTVLKQEALNQLINRQIAYQFLVSRNLAAGPSEIQMQRDALEAELQIAGKSIADYQRSRKLSDKELEFQFAWPVAWNRYLAQLLTDQNLEKHFNRNRARLDGTQVRVAHLLIKADNPEDAINQAQDIAAKLAAGEIEWAVAVENFSAATKESDGELGWIRMDRPMPIAFTEASFSLSIGEISPPVKSSFGVHLIKCLEIKPGKLGWRDAREKVRTDAAKFLFDTIVQQHRSEIDIKVFSKPIRN